MLIPIQKLLNRAHSAEVNVACVAGPQFYGGAWFLNVVKWKFLEGQTFGCGKTFPAYRHRQQILFWLRLNIYQEQTV
jgi:hypothetical protein